MKWPSLTFPPINLWSLPNMVKRYKNDSAYDFEMIEDDLDIPVEIDVHTLHELHAEDSIDEVEQELKDIYGDLDGC